MALLRQAVTGRPWFARKVCEHIAYRGNYITGQYQMVCWFATAAMCAIVPIQIICS